MKQHKKSERGQAIVVFALTAIVLIGFVSLAIDLGATAADRRDLQAHADSAALAGARQYSMSSNHDLNAAHYVALQYLRATLNPSFNFPVGSPSCSGITTCPAGTYTLGSSNNFTVTLQDGTGNTLDVGIQHNNAGFFSGVIGFNTNVSGSSGRAQPLTSAGPFSYALYSQTTAGTGNQVESVQGDVYVGQSINPQSHGHAGFCVDYNPPSSTNQGHIVFGAPQSTSPGVTYSTPCSGNGGGGMVSAAAPSGNCNGVGGNGVSWVGGSINACVANPALNAPTFTAPTVTQTLPSCTISSAITAGVYEVTTSACSGGFTIDMGRSGLTLNCVTFIIDPTVQVSIQGKGGGTITSYGDTAAGCTGPASAKLVLYQPSSSLTPATTVSVQGPGCCPTYNLTGAVYMPSATFSITTNANVNIDGQAIVNTWDNQSGNHSGNVVTYDAAQIPSLPPSGGLVR